MDSVRRLRGESPTRDRQRHRARQACRRRDSEAAQSRRLRSTRSRCSASITTPAMSPVTGARIRSASSRVALGAHWGEVKPFVLQSGSQFRAPPPPAMTSAEYTEAFNEVKRLGGDGITTPTERTEDQTFIGIFWAYDGTPSLCAPPRLYNQIAVDDRQAAGHRRASAWRGCWRSVNVAHGRCRHRDLGIEVLLRRLAAGRRAFAKRTLGTGPTGAGDGNPDTLGDPNFMPLGAPGSNLNGPNFTPPFPAYPSGHAGFGGALFQILRRFYGTDDIAFTFVSDEFNGTTRDNNGNVRPLRPRSFTQPVAGRGRERPEPHLSRHPLVVRQERRHHAGPAGRGLRLVPHLSADPVAAIRGVARRGATPYDCRRHAPNNKTRPSNTRCLRLASSLHPARSRVRVTTIC